MPMRVPVCSWYRQVLIFLQTALQGWVKLSGTWPRHGTVKPLTQDISLRVSSFLYIEGMNNAQCICLSIIYLPTYVPTCLSVLLRWLSGKEHACQCRVNPWISKIPWRRKWQPTPVFLPRKIPWTEESGGLQSMGTKKSWTWLSD